MKEKIKEYIPKEGNGIIYQYVFDNGMEYIGQTSNSLLTRHKQHHCPTMYVDKMIKTHDYSLTVLAEAPIDMLNDLEQYYIELYNTIYPNGLNFNSGGGVGRTLSEYSIQKMKDAKTGKNHWNYGKHRSVETKNKISRSLQNSNHPMYGKQGKDTYYHKPVAQLDKNTEEIIAIFSCAREAERETGISHKHIGDVCKGRRKTTGGYKWIFVWNED